MTGSNIYDIFTGITAGRWHNICIFSVPGHLHLPDTRGLTPSNAFPGNIV